MMMQERISVRVPWKAIWRRRRWCCPSTVSDATLVAGCDTRGHNCVNSHVLRCTLRMEGEGTFFFWLLSISRGWARARRNSPIVLGGLVSTCDWPPSLSIVLSFKQEVHWVYRKAGTAPLCSQHSQCGRWHLRVHRERRGQPIGWVC